MRLPTALLLMIASLAPGYARAADNAAKQAILYKNPNCSCCENYAAYLRSNGYSVTIQPSHDLALINRQNGVPPELEGCHTTLIGGYVVEGHVPVEMINRLLAEHPNIRGISIPGMPMGVPGMEGPKDAPIAVYEITDGKPAVYGMVK
jgi:hypothetical protein